MAAEPVRNSFMSDFVTGNLGSLKSVWGEKAEDSKYCIRLARLEFKVTCSGAKLPIRPTSL